MSSTNGYADIEVEPESETARLRALRAYDIMDTLQEQEFDAITKLATRICDTPVSLINLIDTDRQWTKSATGLDLTEIPREEGVCQYTILDDQPLEIQDLSKDDRFRDKHYQMDEEELIYYAGAPLQTPDGYNIGAICVMDTHQRQLEDWQLESLGILADEVITRLELRLREQKLEELNKHKDEILRVVSHDMRNPLTGIMGIASLIRSDGFENEEELKYLMDMIERSSRQLLDNVNDLLDVAMIESGSLKLEPKKVNLKEITDEVIELQKPSARMKKIALNCSISTTKNRVFLDPVRYRQILGNLITNGIKFTESNGQVDVSVEFPANSEEAPIIKIIVEDDGIGIPEEQQVTLFRRNENYRRQGTSGEKSTGMGLPLLKNLVDAHDGHIEVESEEGEGTAFTVLLPELNPNE